MSNDYCPRLIEVALPIREISAESVRDKRTDQGNISSLHTWWARRPLAASRAVVFASIVLDPDHSACPREFREAVQQLLRASVPQKLRFYRRGRKVIQSPDPYRPYENIADTLRNRLLTFIAKWSPEYLAFEDGTESAEPNSRIRLDDRCLVKWETTDPKNDQGQEVLRVARDLVSAAQRAGVPTVLDPFAGGGVIPLEAARLGCSAIANDYNPVAHIIQHATCCYPQRYGISRTIAPGSSSQEAGQQQELLPTSLAESNAFAVDVEAWAYRLLDKARLVIGHLYPMGKDGFPVYNYMWARTVPCANPSCRAEIPLIRSLLFRPKKPRVALEMGVDHIDKKLRLGIVRGSAVQVTTGTKQQRAPAICPFCNQPTSEDEIRTAAMNGMMRETLLAVVVERSGSRDYRMPEKADFDAIDAARQFDVQGPMEYVVPEITAPSASADAGGAR